MYKNLINTTYTLNKLLYYKYNFMFTLNHNFYSYYLNKSSLTNFTNNLIFSINSKMNSLLNTFLHLTSTFRRKKDKMKKHHTWKRIKKNRNSKKQNLKKK
jgi:hypothetical protein